ncbi:MAG: hypothetical protein MJK04_34080 [Psychrosphaera sp.]|nr:hypothetical protein [Psychrosphaera sp.]
MKTIIFSLDNTLVDTNSCRPYLPFHPTRRCNVVEKIESDEVETQVYDSAIVEYINELRERFGVIVVIASDSPKDYCEAVLAKHGFNIPDEHVFGDLGKPCVDFYEKIVKPLNQTHDKGFAVADYLIVGSSPRDIYFGHHIQAATVFTTWGTAFDATRVIEKCIPTTVANSLADLKNHIAAFLKNCMEYRKPDFGGNFRFIDSEYCKSYELDKQDIGYARDYISSVNLPGTTDELAHQTWIEMNACLKLAKNVPEVLLQNGKAIPVCIDGETISCGVPLKDLAKQYFQDFVEWTIDKQLQGNVALVPVPSSVPRVCNHTFVMALICRWWAEWASNSNLPCALNVCDLLERTNPVKPAHRYYLKTYERKIEPHLESIGVLVDKATAISDDFCAIIIVDDVVTTGTQMNAVATILNGLDMIPNNIPVYGYAWARTVLNGT